MSSPAILQRQRGLGRCVAGGIGGAIGLVLAAVGTILLISDGSTSSAKLVPAAVLVITGAVAFALAEAFARRFEVLDTAGFTWERTFGADRLAWSQARFASEKLLQPGNPDARPELNDRLLVVTPDGRHRRWGRTIKHHLALTTLQYWEQMRAAYGVGRFDIGEHVKPFRLLVDGAEPHTMRVRLRTGGQSVVAGLTLLAALAMAALVISAKSTSQRIGFGVLLVLLLWWCLVATRNLSSAVVLTPQGLRHRRWGAGQVIGWGEVAGVSALAKPKIVSLVPLSIGLALFSLFSSGNADETEGLFDNKCCPQLILRDGRGVPLTALTTLSESKAHRFAHALSLARRVGR